MIPNSQCAPDAVPCCTDYFDVAAQIVAQVQGRIADCVEAPCNVQLLGTVLFSEDLVIPDSLVFVIDRVRADTRTVNNRAVKLSSLVMEGRVRLLESGYPIVTDEGGALRMPPLEDFERAAKHLIAHGQVLHRTLLGMRNDGGIPNACVLSRVGDLLPIDPDSGVAGWEVSVETLVL